MPIIEETPIVGTTGLKIKVDADFDISSGSLFELHYCKPNGTYGSFTGSYETADSKHYVVYTTTSSGDIDQKGKWTFQIYVEMGANKFWGKEVKSPRFEDKIS